MSIFGISMNMTDFSIVHVRKIDEPGQNRKTVSSVVAIADYVNTSHATSFRQDAKAIARSEPDIDAALVSEMKAVIASGRLVIDYDSLAQKMLALESELNSVLPPLPETD